MRSPRELDHIVSQAMEWARGYDADPKLNVPDFDKVRRKAVRDILSFFRDRDEEEEAAAVEHNLAYNLAALSEPGQLSPGVELEALARRYAKIDHEEGIDRREELSEVAAGPYSPVPMQMGDDGPVVDMPVRTVRTR